jgi:hypothetical protein
MRSQATHARRNAVVRCERGSRIESAADGGCCAEFAIQSHDAKITIAELGGPRGTGKVRGRSRKRRGLGLAVRADRLSFLRRQNDSQRSVRPFLEAPPTADCNSRLSLQFCFCRVVFHDKPFWMAEYFANGSAFVHVPALLSTWNVCAAGFTVLAIGIAPIPCKTQSLFSLRILDGSDAATRPFCGEYATNAERSIMEVSHDRALWFLVWFLDRRAQVV